MSNSPKQLHEGFWYHVYSRSEDGVQLFSTDSERKWFLDRLDQTFSRRRVKLGALCLMDTNYHALVRMGGVKLDRALNGLHMTYAKYLNKKRDRSGAVFRSHPGTDLVLKEKYLLQLVPYIHNKPVEAGLVESPRDYEWNTDPLYRTGEWKYGPLDCWEFPPVFQEDPSRIYRKRMDEAVEEPERAEGYIGTKEEWKQLEKRIQARNDRFRNRPEMSEIAAELAKKHEIKVEDLKKPGRSQPEVKIRQQAMVEMYEEGYGPQEIGNFFNRNKGTVVYAVQKNQQVN